MFVLVGVCLADKEDDENRGGNLKCNLFLLFAKLFL